MNTIQNKAAGTKIYLAAVSHIKSPIVGKIKPHYLLESFIDLRGNSPGTQKYMQWAMTADDFLLDSGAFAFINKKKNNTDYVFTEKDINQYIEDYIDFINKWDIQNFFEMDLDCIIDYEAVKLIRRRIEDGTGKKVIPVWHLSRGMEEFCNMCKEYDYVAIGGIASKEIKKSNYQILWDLCKVAHDYGCRIHGLGWLPLPLLNDGTCPFDTVDGTSYQRHRWAEKFRFEGDNLIRERDIELSEKKRTWKENEEETFRLWTEYSYIVENKEAGRLHE